MQLSPALDAKFNDLAARYPVKRSALILMMIYGQDELGAVTEWSVEMTAPNHLVHYGWNGKKLKPGDQITVVGLPSKNGLKVLNLRKISWANGEVIPLGPPPEPGQ